MLNRRDFVKMTMLGVTQLALNGCFKPISNIRVAAHVWPGYEILFVADHLELIDHSLVDLVETHSASVSMRLLGSGTVECACLTMDEVFTCNDRGFDLAVISIIDFSSGADVVMAAPGIKSFRDVRGKTVGVESTATGAVMLNNFLKKANLLPSDIDIRLYTIDQHEAAFHSGEVDLLVTYDPVKSRLEDAGMINIYDSSLNPNQIMDVLAVTRSALTSHKAQLEHLLQVYFKALNSFFENPQAVLPLLINRMQLPEEDIDKVYQGISMPGLAENKQLIGGREPLLIANMEVLANTMLTSGLLRRMPDIERILAPQFLNAISE